VDLNLKSCNKVINIVTVSQQRSGTVKITYSSTGPATEITQDSYPERCFGIWLGR